jgi:hypothetical protein
MNGNSAHNTSNGGSGVPKDGTPETNTNPFLLRVIKKY